jgi:hypothetical protein
VNMEGPASLDQAAGSFERLFQTFEGEWRLEKSMSDGSLFTGTAKFERAADNCLSLTESGVLTLPGAQLQAGRAWDWFLRERCSLEIRYPHAHGGGPYHLLTPVRLCDGWGADGWAGSATHLCGADAYLADYSFSEDAILIDHSVKGPKKGYRIEARMRR